MSFYGFGCFYPGSFPCSHRVNFGYRRSIPVVFLPNRRLADPATGPELINPLSPSLALGNEDPCGPHNGILYGWLFLAAPLSYPPMLLDIVDGVLWIFLFVQSVEQIPLHLLRSQISSCLSSEQGYSSHQ